MRALCIQWRVGTGTKSLILLIAPVPEAIFLENLLMCVCYRRFSSINISSDFTYVTFSIGSLIINRELGLARQSTQFFVLIQLA